MDPKTEWNSASAQGSLKRNGILLLVAVALISLVTSQQLATSAQVPVGGGAATVVRFTSIESLIGPSAPFGTRPLNGALLAVKEINDAGGFQDTQGNKYTLELTKQDMANDRNEAIALLRQAASNPQTVAVLGPSNSVGFLANAPVVNQLKIPNIGTGSSAPIKQWNEWLFRVNPVTSTAVPVMLKTLVPKLNIKRIAIIYDQTQDAQAADAQMVRSLASTIGYQVVADTAFRTGDQDFSAQIANIKASNPDVVYVAASGEGPKVTTQLRAAGVEATLMAGFGFLADTLYWDNSNGAVKGGYTWLGQDLASPTAEVKKFIDNYVKMFPDSTVTPYAAYGFDAVYALVAAVKKARSGTDRERVQKALSDLEITSPLGTHIVFKNPPTGDNLSPTVTIVQVTGRGTYVKIK